MAANTIKFVQLSQNSYNTLETKSAYTLYFTTDTKRLYKGDTFYSQNINVVKQIPAFENAHESILYVNETTGQMYIKGASAMIRVGADILSSANAYTDSTASSLLADMSEMSENLLSSITDLGSVFELKGYANAEDHTVAPWSIEITGLEKGDVYLLDEQNPITNETVTVEYVCVDPTATGAAKFQRLGSTTEATATATKNYVDGKYSENSASISTLRADSSAYASSLYSQNSASITSLDEKVDRLDSQNSESHSSLSDRIDNLSADSSAYAESLYSENSQSISTLDAKVDRLDAESSEYTDTKFSELSAYVDNSIVWQIIS